MDSQCVPFLLVLLLFRLSPRLVLPLPLASLFLLLVSLVLTTVVPSMLEMTRIESKRRWNKILNGSKMLRFPRLALEPGAS